MMKKAKILLLAAVLLLAFAQVAFPALRAVGPINPDNGFPLWYRSFTGQTVTLSVPPNAVSIPDAVIAGNAFSAQIGFGSEAMYWHSTATMAVPGGDALLVLALEAAFATGDAAPNEQIVFARVRIRIDTAVAGDYTVIHPYGQRTFTDVPVGNRAINDTIDIGAVPGDFAGALQGDIGPFLVQVGRPAGTLGDGATLAPVTGSPTGNNFFRVIGPDGTTTTNQFVTGGEAFDGTPFTITRSTFSRDAGGATFAEIFASVPTPVPAGITMAATLPGQAEAPMTRRGNAFFVRIPFTTPVLPSDVTVTGRINGVNRTDDTANLIDTVRVTKAEYRIAAQTLRVAATSSDAQATLRGFGWIGATAAGQPLLAAGADTDFANVVWPPISLSVKSALGGNQGVRVTILP
jgi:hypothetical protein